MLVSVREAHACEQLAQGLYVKVQRPGVLTTMSPGDTNSKLKLMAQSEVQQSPSSGEKIVMLMMMVPEVTTSRRYA